MRLHLAELIKLLYKQEKENYPDLSEEQIEEVCRAPIDFIKENMEKPSFPTIKVKFFGSFAVYDGRIRYLLKKNNMLLHHGRSIESYNKSRASLEALLLKLQEGFPNTIYLTDDTEPIHTTIKIEV